jgi:hypothetical protein
VIAWLAAKTMMTICLESPSAEKQSRRLFNETPRISPPALEPGSSFDLASLTNLSLSAGAGLAIAARDSNPESADSRTVVVVGRGYCRIAAAFAIANGVVGGCLTLFAWV